MKSVRCDFKTFKPIISSLLDLDLSAFKKGALKDKKNEIPTKKYQFFAKASKLHDRFENTEGSAITLNHDEARIILKCFAFLTNMLNDNPSLTQGVEGIAKLKQANEFLTVYCSEIFFDTLSDSEKNRAVEYIRQNGYSSSTITTILNQF